MSVEAVASILLGAALLLAGGAKLAAGAAWPVQARELGAPEVAIPVVPWAEIAVGAALCVQLVAPLFALVALGMLACFTALLVVRLRQGRRPLCACFGSWSAKPLSWRHVARNLVLMVIALTAIVAA